MKISLIKLGILLITPQIAYRVTAYRVDSAYRVGFTWNQIILGVYIVRTDLILGRYSVAYRVDCSMDGEKVPPYVIGK